MSKILVIEDHDGIREAYELLFIKEGYEVDTVDDGGPALEKVKEAEYDLILLDMMLPELSGIEFLRQFKPVEHQTKVVVFSNLENEDITKEAMSLGVSKYIRKATVPPKEMAEIVAGVLAG
ncbi:response regulator [Candidatus Saccharibacteria bacterium]|nr:response regulator [Candidatus Saccharibacteria bacterium]